MPKYDYWAGFKRDYDKLPPELRAAFDVARRAIVKSLKETGRLPHPKLVQKMSGYDVYEVRWGPNGRATFHIEQQNGEDVFVWRRIGDHSILANP